MTDRHAGYIVTLANDIRDGDAESVITALRMVRGVIAVEPIAADADLHLAEARADRAAWKRMLAAREDLAAILRRGTTPTPSTLGAILAELGGDNPYAGGRPDGADSWWDAWIDPAADPESYDWERYERTINPDAQLDGLGDLCAFLGGSWTETPGSGSITALILQLIVKSQATPDRYAAVSRAFPREAAAWRVWMAMSPSPTARELYEELTAALPARVPARAAGRLARLNAGDDAGGLRGDLAAAAELEQAVNERPPRENTP